MMRRLPWSSATSSALSSAAPWLALLPRPDLGRATPSLGLTTHAWRRLSIAMLEDTVAALTSVQRIGAVVVLWENPAELEEMRGFPGVMHLVAQHPEVSEALPGVEQQLQRWVRPTGRIVVTGNRPACSSREVDRLLNEAATSPRCFLPDSEGRAAVVTALAGIALQPSHDSDAGRQHRTHGARPLPPHRFASLARGIDTLADLHEATRLGAGPATVAVARDLQLLPPNSPRCPNVISSASDPWLVGRGRPATARTTT